MQTLSRAVGMRGDDASDSGRMTESRAPRKSGNHLRCRHVGGGWVTGAEQEGVHDGGTPTLPLETMDASDWVRAAGIQADRNVAAAMRASDWAGRGGWRGGKGGVEGVNR